MAGTLCGLTVENWIGISTVCVTAVGLWFVYGQLSLLAKQFKLEHYSNYTKRYQEIAMRFPEDVNKPDFSMVNRPDYDQTMRQMRAYFDLCFEEWDLNKKKLIDPQFWEVWKDGMQFAFSKPAFQQAWSIIRTDSSFGAEFESFVDDSMSRSLPV